MTARLATAQTPVQRLTAACEYARSTVARLDPATAQTLADELVRVLIGACDTAQRRELRR